MSIESKSDAIKYLSDRGYRAKERNWVLGQTIEIFVGRQEETKIGDLPITVSEGILSIYPVNDKWSINDANNMGETEDNVYESLHAAVIAAEEMANNYSIIQAERRNLRMQNMIDNPHTLTPLDPSELLRSSGDLLKWNTHHPKAGKFLFRSEEAMHKVWIEQGGIESEMPQIDFTTKMVVGIFLDEGTYKSALGIGSVKKEGNSIKVFYSKIERPWNMINPCSVFKINRAEGDVEFIQNS